MPPALCCPACQWLAPEKIESPKDGAVLYFRCSSCGHFWETKRDSDDPEPEGFWFRRKPDRRQKQEPLTFQDRRRAARRREAKT